MGKGAGKGKGKKKGKKDKVPSSAASPPRRRRTPAQSQEGLRVLQGDQESRRRSSTRIAKKGNSSTTSSRRIVEKKRLEDKKAELRNKESGSCRIWKKKHAVEVKVYKQRVKHLLLRAPGRGHAGRRKGKRLCLRRRPAHRSTKLNSKLIEEH